MNLITTTGLTAADRLDMELVERKGAGHPDTLADGVAEAVSRLYSIYCLEHFGAILHHNTDKTALLGGAAEVGFGHGRLTEPIVALVNGRLTPALGDHVIPVEEIIATATTDFLGRSLPLLNAETDLVIRSRMSQASSPGAVAGPTDDQRAGRRFWFMPRSLEDLPELERMFANDTSAGVGYAPLGVAERLALKVESLLTSPEFTAVHPQFGTDVKLMVVRIGTQVHVTACVPQIAAHTPDLDAYVAHRAQAGELITDLAAELAPGHRVQVAVNTRDDDTRRELYLTAIGSSIESGDEGVVGRGNRANGLISMFRPMSMEGVSGKNSVYHVGKLYNLAAQRVAVRLHEETGRTYAVALVSQSGRDLTDPWQVLVQASGDERLNLDLIRKAVTVVMDDLDDIRTALLDGALPTV